MQSPSNLKISPRPELVGVLSELCMRCLQVNFDDHYAIILHSLLYNFLYFYVYILRQSYPSV